MRVRVAAKVVGKGSGQSFGFDSFAGLVLARNFEAGKGGYPLAAAFKDMTTFEELVHARLQADHLPSVVAGTMQTYKEAPTPYPPVVSCLVVRALTVFVVLRRWARAMGRSTRARW